MRLAEPDLSLGQLRGANLNLIPVQAHQNQAIDDFLPDPNRSKCTVHQKKGFVIVGGGFVEPLVGDLIFLCRFLNRFGCLFFRRRGEVAGKERGLSCGSQGEGWRGPKESLNSKIELGVRRGTISSRQLWDRRDLPSEVEEGIGESPNEEAEGHQGNDRILTCAGRHGAWN